jgi:hypothetical protein
MNMEVALNALERGSCLEVYYGHRCVVIDPQVVGLDAEGHPIVLGVERLSERVAPLAQWLVLRLDNASLVDVAGYLSEGARAGWDRGNARFSKIVR